MIIAWILLIGVMATTVIAVSYTLRCPNGLIHTFIQTDSQYITMPKLGPYDPRPDAERSAHRAMQICVHCGEKRPKHDWLVDT